MTVSHVLFDVLMGLGILRHGECYVAGYEPKQQTNKQTKFHSFVLNILLPGCSNGFKQTIMKPCRNKYQASRIMPLNGNSCSHGDILCASVCAAEFAIHHLQENISKVKPTLLALVIILSSEILSGPSRNELCIQLCSFSQ